MSIDPIIDPTSDPNVELSIDRSPATQRGRSERGASLVEYALLLAFVVVVCLGALELIGQDTSSSLTGVGNSLISANQP